MLGIVDVPIRYLDRTYGATNISRFRHGFVLAKMTLIGFFGFDSARSMKHLDDPTRVSAVKAIISRKPSLRVTTKLSTEDTRMPGALSGEGLRSSWVREPGSRGICLPDMITSDVLPYGALTVSLTGDISPLPMAA